MAQWRAFFGVTLVILVVLLVLARRSQQLIHDHASDADSTPTATQPSDGDEGTGSDSTPTATQSQGADDAGDTDSAADAVRGQIVRETPLDTDSAREVTEGPESADGIPESTDPHAEDDGYESSILESTGAGPREADESPSSAASSGTPSAAQPAEFVLTPRMLLGNVAFTQALVAGSLLIAAWYFAIPAAAFGVADSQRAAAIAVVVGLVLGVGLWIGNEVATTLADAVGAAYDETVRELLAPESVGGWVVLFALVLPLISLSEELLFRAALIGVPASGFGISPWLLAVGSSLAFAVGHGAQGRVGVVVTGVLGFALAAGYILSGSLLVVVVAHYVVNSMEFGVHELLGIDSLQ